MTIKEEVLAKALAECLEAEQRGDSALRFLRERYPGFEQELAPLLELTPTLQQQGRARGSIGRPPKWLDLPPQRPAPSVPGLGLGLVAVSVVLLAVLMVSGVLELRSKGPGSSSGLVRREAVSADKAQSQTPPVATIAPVIVPAPATAPGFPTPHATATIISAVRSPASIIATPLPTVPAATPPRTPAPTPAPSVAPIPASRPSPAPLTSFAGPPLNPKKPTGAGSVGTLDVVTGEFTPGKNKSGNEEEQPHGGFVTFQAGEITADTWVHKVLPPMLPGGPHHNCDGKGLDSAEGCFAE